MKFVYTSMFILRGHFFTDNATYVRYSWQNFIRYWLQVFSYAFAFFAYLLFFPFHLRFHLLHLSFVCPQATENAIMKLDDATQRGEICSWLISLCELPSFSHEIFNTYRQSYLQLARECLTIVRSCIIFFSGRIFSYIFFKFNLYRFNFLQILQNISAKNLGSLITICL